MMLSSLLELFPNDMWGYEYRQPAFMEDIRNLETELQQELPYDYKEYLLHFNGTLIPGEYIHCIKKGNDPYTFDLQKEREFYRKNWKIPEDFLPFNADGIEGLYGFKKGVSGVYHWYNGNIQRSHNSFTEWLREKLVSSAEMEGISLDKNITLEIS